MSLLRIPQKIESDFVEILSIENDYLNMVNVCKICGLPNPEEDHLKVYHIDETGLIKCYFCSLMFMNMNTLLQHVRIHNEDHIICRYCGDKFSVYESYITHLLLSEDHSFYRCLEHDCGYITDLNREIYNHMVYHVILGLQKKVRKNNQLCFMCPDPMCPFETKNKSDVKDHLYNHAGKRKFMCSFCTFGSKDQSLTIEHIKNLHKDKTNKPEEAVEINQ